MNIIWNRELDLDLWQKLHSSCNKKYMNKRLLAIKYLYEGKDIQEVSNLIDCNEKTLINWIDKFLTGGIEELIRPIRRQQRAKLKLEHKKELIKILLEKTPRDYEMNGDEWLAKNIIKLINIKWDITLKQSTVYKILDELKEMSPLLREILKKEKQLDLELWEKFYSDYKEENLRKRLWAIKYFYEGKSRKEILNLVNCSSKSLTTWVNDFRRGGLEYLLHPKNMHNLIFKLSLEDKQELIKILRIEKPVNYGISSDLWTSKNIGTLIKLKWGIELKTSQICEILDEVENDIQLNPEASARPGIVVKTFSQENIVTYKNN